jgi:DNA-binding NarL/FixJ family response regulator
VNTGRLAEFPEGIFPIEHTSDAHAPALRDPSWRSAVKPKTYIVEDNGTIRENLVGTLEELACIEAVGWADTEADARAWLAAHADGWDLAIVDLFLKEGSGLGVLEACGARGPTRKVVVLSNYATPDMRKRCMSLGADAVFDKSNEIDALIDYCMGLSAA